jgi:Tol biopolymer transport system component
MTIPAGTKLGRYEILSKIGEGGMGEVYRARDARLNRDVAIKVLPAAFSSDAERLRRFEQEARAASALNHPNILAIHDTGTTDDATPFVVSELLEGETLREKLSDGGLPVRKALDYSLQVARGLAAAHGKGIVHRDLKPENLFVTRDGRVKILDFGIAKLISRKGGGVELDAEAPTQMVKTDSGVVIGTVGYMSPEQVRGQAVDARSDIFSFGAILYETLAGRRAFQGASHVETMNAILKDEPPELSVSTTHVSAAIERVVRRCLEKEAEERFQSASDLAFALDALSGVQSSNATAAIAPGDAAKHTRAKWRSGLPWAVAGVAVLTAALAFALPYFRSAPEGRSIVRFHVAIPDGVDPPLDVEIHSMAVSPDGRHLAFVGDAGGQRRIWMRALDATAAVPLPGTEGANSIFWSPNSGHLAFFADGKLKRAEVSGKSLQIVCNLSAPIDATGSWGSEGTIIYAEEKDGNIYRVSAAGGTPSLLLPSKGDARRWLHFLPDGRRFLFYKYDEGENNKGLYAGSLDSKEIRPVASIEPARAQYVKDGYLLYPRDGSLVAQPFDEKNLRLTGEPSVVVERLPYFDKTGWAEFSASEEGVIVHRAELPKNRLVWLDRTGRELGQAGEPGYIYSVRLSPDGQRAVLTIDETISGSDIWIQDLSRDTRTRFVSGPTDDSGGTWSEDGRRLAYFSCCEDASAFHIKELGDTGKGQLPVKEQSWAAPIDWSRDGRFILYWADEDLWVLPASGAEKPYLWMQSRPKVRQARFSPDGRWVAFVSEETGRPEIYVTAFDRPGEKTRISTEGGNGPRWRSDGKEMFYVTIDSKVMSVPVSSGDQFAIGKSALLFKGDPRTMDYDVTADGQRFIILASTPGTQHLPFAVVLNWSANLKN